MKLAAARPTTQGERIFALEEARKADGERLDRIEKKIEKVDEMHEILVGLRSIGRAVKLMAYWLGGPSVVAGAAVWVWKALH